jgi:Zn-dependent protease with chaperone function
MTISQIQRSFGHRLIGTQLMKRMVAITLQRFPPKIIDRITGTTWFVGSFPDGWAFTIRGDELKKNEHLIFLTDELMQEKEDQIIWTIAHEIGHVILGHRNSIGRVQTKVEVKRQEKQADEFARNYLD